MIKDASSHNGTSIYHEMAGDISCNELQKLKDNGFMIVSIVRDPRKQFTSLTRLLSLYREVEAIANTFGVGWIDRR